MQRGTARVRLEVQGRMIGLSTAPIWPAVFMQPVTSPACGPAMSRQTPQQAPSRKLSAAPDRAIRRAESDRVVGRSPRRSARRPATRSDAPPTPHRPTRSPYAAGQPIGRQAAHQVGHRAEDQRQARQHARQERRRARPSGHVSRQVGRQPGDVEVEAVRLGEVHQAERDQVPVGQDRAGAPRRRAGAAALRLPARLDVASAPPRSTAGCSAGSSRNQRYQASAQTKPIEPKTTKITRQGRTPSRAVDQERRQPAAQVRPREEDALRRAALGDREPSREGLGDVRKGPRLAHAEQEPDQPAATRS